MYEDRVVFYIDVLGFTNFILDKQNRYKDVIEESMNSILKISQIFHETHNGKIDVSTSIMSDSIVCSFIVKSRKRNILNLTALLLACIAFQVSLLRSGILSRGAIVRAGLNHMDNLVYGPAMIKAYNMERNDAIYPRVILDDNIKELIQSLNEKRINDFIEEDSDLICYVNYISHLKEFGADRDEILEIIISKIEQEEEKISKKYEWVKEKL